MVVGTQKFVTIAVPSIVAEQNPHQHWILFWLGTDLNIFVQFSHCPKSLAVRERSE